MVALAGPFLVTVALLATGGALKVRRPADTARALGIMGLPSSPALVRIGATVELAVAVAAAITGNRLLAAAVALSYLGFAASVWAALRRGAPLSSCGCFGSQDTSPTYVHVVLDLAAAAVAGAVALGPPAPAVALGDLGRIDGSPVLPVVFLALTATAAWLAYVALALLPRVLHADSPQPAPTP